MPIALSSVGMRRMRLVAVEESESLRRFFLRSLVAITSSLLLPATAPVAIASDRKAMAGDRSRGGRGVAAGDAGGRRRSQVS